MTGYRTLGRSGLKVSRLSLGTMTFGNEAGWGASEAASRRMFDLYLEKGGNFLDTADGYTGGTSETWVGKFVQETKTRDKVVLATKFTFNQENGNPNTGGNARKNIYRAIDASLRRLQMDYIDLYILHCWDRFTPAEEVLRTMDDLVRAGKIRYVGLSDVPSWYAARMQTLAEVRGFEPVTSIQLEYSLAERSIEAEFFPMGEELGIAINPWSPLASGLLSGKYMSLEQDKPVEGRLEKLKGTANPAFQKFNDRNWAIVAELERVSGEIGRPMAQVALNWVANRPNIGSVILGATKPEQLADNLAALDFAIPDEMLVRLNAVSEPEIRFPYTFFQSEIQNRISGSTSINNR